MFISDDQGITPLLYSYKGRRIPLYLCFLLVFVVSWPFSSFTLISPFLLSNKTEIFPFYIIICIVEAIAYILSGYFSDTKGRSRILLLAFRIFMYGIAIVTITTLIHGLTSLHYIRFEVEEYKSHYSLVNSTVPRIYRRSYNGILDNMSGNKYNFLTFDETLLYKGNNIKYSDNLFGKFINGTYIIKENHDYKDSDEYSSLDHDSIKDNLVPCPNIILSMVLFFGLCLVYGGASSAYMLIFIYIMEVSCKSTSRMQWYEFCFASNAYWLSLLISRIISMLIINIFFKEQSDYFLNFCITLCSISILFPLVIYALYMYLEDPCLYRWSRIVFFTNMGYLDLLIKHIKFRNNYNVFAIIIPWWIIIFIQRGNNFYEWIHLSENLTVDLIWWNSLCLTYESIFGFFISLMIPILVLQFPPKFMQLYSFTFLSIVSFGLSISISTVHQIPIKTFSDFLGAFLLCHGVYHCCTIIPSVTVVLLIFDITHIRVRGTILGFMFAVVNTAPVLDNLINKFASNIFSVSWKFLLDTVLLIIALVATMIFIYKIPNENNNIRDIYPMYTRDNQLPPSKPNTF
ncbi:hypothetical protein ACR3K2_30090 [Cryptosporidium serpentis]